MSPKILTVSGCAHPKAEVQRIDNENGVLYFAWLNASSVRVDSGNSVARFTPSWTEENGKREYSEPTDAELIAAIQSA